MNKVVWRCMKLFLLVTLVYGVLLRFTYHQASRRDLPFNQQRSKSLGAEDATTHLMVHQEIPDGKPAPLPASQAPIHQAPMVGPPKTKPPTTPGRTFKNTLLRKPQQKEDFYHVVKSRIWPDPDQPQDDRIISQMSYGLSDKPDGVPRKTKQILNYWGRRDGMDTGKSSFVAQNCPVTDCELTFDASAARTADVILWQDRFAAPHMPRPPKQIWMIFFLESPYHTPSLQGVKNKMNWTATYRRDSTIVAPYERFTLFNSSVVELPLVKNYAEGKTKKVAWFVSNCGARNNRLGYANELGKYIDVDIYGSCGPLKCPKSDYCFKLLSTTYKFYLAFENSNCRDYITEKFFVNGLQNDVLPIVMGAHPDDYRNSAPKNSYIHVDDFESPEHLAKYLHELDKDDKKYNEYFRWKGTGTNINTYFWCRVCAMAHAVDEKPPPPPPYEDVDNWWRGQGVCKSLDHKLWPKW